MSKVTIILGSISDKPILEKCRAVFEEFGVEYDVFVASAHRSPEKVDEIVKNSKADVFVAIAGLSAALPGVIASKTTKPVIGVPVDSKAEPVRARREMKAKFSATLGGLDALLSTAQMPPGIPVASVGIDRGENAALLAIEIFALKDEKLRKKLEDYRKKMRGKIEKDNKEL